MSLLYGSLHVCDTITILNTGKYKYNCKYKLLVLSVDRSRICLVYTRSFTAYYIAADAVQCQSSQWQVQNTTIVEYGVSDSLNNFCCPGAIREEITCFTAPVGFRDQSCSVGRSRRFHTIYLERKS